MRNMHIVINQGKGWRWLVLPPFLLATKKRPPQTKGDRSKALEIKEVVIVQISHRCLSHWFDSHTHNCASICIYFTSILVYVIINNLLREKLITLSSFFSRLNRHWQLTTVNLGNCCGNIRLVHFAQPTGYSKDGYMDYLDHTVSSQRHSLKLTLFKGWLAG